LREPHIWSVQSSLYAIEDPGRFNLRRDKVVLSDGRSIDGYLVLEFSPWVTVVTVALSWFRALSCMHVPLGRDVAAPFCVSEARARRRCGRTLRPHRAVPAMSRRARSFPSGPPRFPRAGAGYRGL